MTQRFLFIFSADISEKPIVSNLIKDYDLEVNIYRAKITRNEEGYMILDLSGSEENIKNGISFLEELKVTVSASDSGIIRNEEVCTDCGNCVSHCPTKALHIPNKKTMAVEFDVKLCIECLNCIKNCPFGACSSIFQ